MTNPCCWYLRMECCPEVGLKRHRERDRTGGETRRVKYDGRQGWMRREVKCWDEKVICVGEELLNGVFWSFNRDRNSQLLAGLEWLRFNKERDKRRWMSLYRLSAALWHSCLCLCCLIYTQASAGTALPSSLQRIMAKWKESLAKKQAFWDWHQNLRKRQSVHIMEALNFFTGITFEWGK